MENTKAFTIGALVMFGSAMWAALMTDDYRIVIAVLSVPSLIAGYIFVSSVSQYIWGMLLGICAYMLVEYMLYGPVYHVTGLVYAAGFVLAAIFALSYYLIRCFKPRRS